MTDAPRERYEVLRDCFLGGVSMAQKGALADFVALGFWSLLCCRAAGGYVIEVCEAPVPRWSGKRDPRLDTLRHVYGILTKGGFAGMTGEHQRRCA